MEGLASTFSSLEANHLIWVWIMKVKGPKNQADFIEVLYNFHNPHPNQVVCLQTNSDSALEVCDIWRSIKLPWKASFWGLANRL